MTRDHKMLGLAFAAILAISAVGAPAASAAEFHSEAATTTLSGSQTTTHTFGTDVGKVSCKIATFAGLLNDATTIHATVTPTYKECTLALTINGVFFGNIAVTIDFKGCDYHFIASGHTEIRCPSGSGPVTVSGPGCTITVPAQTLASAVSYANTGSGSSRDVDLTANASGIKYSYTGFTCGSGSNTTNGTYTGVSTIQGSAGIWVS